MTPGEIIEKLHEKTDNLTTKNDEYLIHLEKVAVARRKYNIALATEFTKLNLNGEAKTLIPKLAVGNEAVAKLGYALDIAEGVCKAHREAMNDLRVVIDMYRSELSFLKAEMRIT